MSRFSPTLAVLALVAGLAAPAAAGPSILLDEVHGQDCRAMVAALWPDCPLDALTPDAFAIETMLASGVLAVAETTLTVTVPAGAPMLYGRFDCAEIDIQFPFIRVEGPDGALVAQQFRGAFHVEAPVAGSYQIDFASWEPVPVPFEIGIGPPFFTAAALAGHDVVFRFHENTFFLFEGELPEYSAAEEALLAGAVAAGGGNLLLREPLLEIALKPIIDLTSPVALTCDVRVELPGTLTFAEPACRTTAHAGGTTLDWDDVAVAPGGVTRLAYEGSLQPAHHQLQVDAAGPDLTFVNHTGGPLYEVSLVRRVGPDAWDLIAAGDLSPRAVVTASGPRRLDRAAIAAALGETITAGGLRGGLSAVQMAEFQGRYRWVDRVLDAAARDRQWTALYRVDTAACDAVLPLVTAPSASVRARTLWFWVTGIPADETWQGPWPAGGEAAPLASVAGAASPLVMQEYGVIRQRYPARAGKATRELAWFGWSFYDDAGLEDPTDNDGDPRRPYISMPGGHPDAGELLAEIPWLEGVTMGVVTAPESERVVVGDDDAHTSDFVFPPGSHPAVVVAKTLGLGRAAALHDRHFADPAWPYNRIFLRRMLDWVAPPVTSAPPGGLPPAVVTALAVRPNPFNPRTEIAFAVSQAGPVRVAVYDAAGRLAVELLRGEVPAGEERLAWDGRDGRGRALAAGVYLVRVEAAGGVRSAKATLLE